jgi:hypothetical protein
MWWLLGWVVGGFLWLRTGGVRVAKRMGTAVAETVTPLNTYAALAAISALALGVSQFFDYKSVQVDSLYYEGEVGGVADAPRVETHLAGSAHLYLLVPVAIAALALIWMTYVDRSRWQLARWVGVLGLFAVLVSLAVDLPQGLDTGLSGIAFAGSQADLIEGYYAQLSAAVVLAASGFALAAEARRAADHGVPRRPRGHGVRLPWRRRRSPAPEAPGVATPWRLEP